MASEALPCAVALRRKVPSVEVHLCAHVCVSLSIQCQCSAYIYVSMHAHEACAAGDEAKRDTAS